jgi:putative peptidoglycan lipid II flippase
VAGGIARASALLASGTLVSRILGFISGVVLAQTLGSYGTGANTFALANQLPNNIYAIIAGGLLSAVFVPAIVRAGLHDDGGQRFINRLVTLGIVAFVSVAALATLAAPLLVNLYAQSGDAGFSQDDLALAITFAYWCLPQVLFYALYSLLGEVLNARGIFGPFTWAPVLNNVVAIAGLLTFTVLFGSDAGRGTADTWTPGMVALLAGSATLGVAVQALVLCLFWRRAGLRYSPDFRWRGVGLGTAGKAAAWTFGMILVTQLAGIVQTRIASLAAGPDSDDPSLAVLRYTWLIFMLPHSIAAVSIATAYFTRMSTHARDGRLDEVRTDLRTSLLTIGLIIAFAAVGLIVLAFPFSRLFVNNGFDGIVGMAPVLMAFLLGLVPFSMLHVLRRTFYALEDTRTPFFITVFQSVLFVGGALLAGLLPVPYIALGIAVVTTIAGTAQTLLAAVLIRRRLGAFGGRMLVSRHLVFFAAALVAAAVGGAIVWLLGGFSDGGWALGSPVSATVTMGVAGVAMAALYFACLLLVRNPEAVAFVSPVTRRLRRPPRTPQ